MLKNIILSKINLKYFIIAINIKTFIKVKNYLYSYIFIIIII